MYDEDLANLEDCLRRLKTEYHIFFAGNRKTPPDDLRLRVEKMVKRLSECSDLSFSQRFRFNTLITRYYVYRDLWRRTQAEKEMGRDAGTEAAPARDTSPHHARTAQDKIRISISDPKAEEEKVRALYDALLRVKGSGENETPLSYAQFAKYIATQTRNIQTKHNCTAVAFSIAIEDDAIRFTASADSR
jgi:hypothetical protein